MANEQEGAIYFAECACNECFGDGGAPTLPPWIPVPWIEDGWGNPGPNSLEFFVNLSSYHRTDEVIFNNGQAVGIYWTLDIPIFINSRFLDGSTVNPVKFLQGVNRGNEGELGLSGGGSGSSGKTVTWVIPISTAPKTLRIRSNNAPAVQVLIPQGDFVALNATPGSDSEDFTVLNTLFAGVPLTLRWGQGGLGGFNPNRGVVGVRLSGP